MKREPGCAKEPAILRIPERVAPIVLTAAGVSRASLVALLALAVAVLALAARPSTATAGEYTPAGLYEVHTTTLANGLRVVLRSREGARNVAIRLVVHVGMYDFPCGYKETPHFLEHLLFTGTSRHTERELDALIEDHGGSWNASTGGEKTTYQVDIFSKHTDVALNTLYEIITDSQISAENVALSRDIVHREMGGRPSTLRRWLYRYGIGVDAEAKADDLLWPAHMNCAELQTADAITREDVLQAFAKYYVANNMALIVVGDFSQDSVLTQIERTFGQLVPSNLGADDMQDVVRPIGYHELSGTLSPVLGSDAEATLAFSVPGYVSADVFALMILREHLNLHLYNELRVARGLSYAPGSSLGLDQKTGVFKMFADVDRERIEDAVTLLLEHVDDLQARPLDAAAVERMQRRILLGFAQAYQDNADIADYYASNWRRFERDGAFTDLEAAVKAVSADDVAAVAHRYVHRDNLVVIRSSPLLSHSQFYGLLLVVLLLALLLTWRSYRGLHSRRRSKLH